MLSKGRREGMNEARLRKQLEVDEGVKVKVYKDTKGLLTVGVGHLIKEGDVVSNTQIEKWFVEDVQGAVSDVMALVSTFLEQPDEIQEVLVNMMFNLGKVRLGKFKKMIQAVNRREYSVMVKEMKDSQWYEQVGSRAERLCKVVERYI